MRPKICAQIFKKKDLNPPCLIIYLLFYVRQQKMIEDGDFELTKELLGDVTASSGGINFNPDSKEDFEELRNGTFYLYSYTDFLNLLDV